MEADARAAAVAENAERVVEGRAPTYADPQAILPDPKAQRNFTGRESKIMPTSNKGWDQFGNSQVIVTQSQGLWRRP
jgi:hypothetical protein